MNREEFDAQCAHWSDEELVEWFRASSTGEDIINVILDAEEELQEGGLMQFYDKCYVASQQLVDSLMAIGEVERASIILESQGRFPDGVQPRQVLEIGEPFDLVEDMVGGSNAFCDLDDRLNNLPDTLDRSLARYIRRNLNYYFKSSRLEIELDFFLEYSKKESEPF